MKQTINIKSKKFWHKTISDILSNEKNILFQKTRENLWNISKIGKKC